MDSSMCHIKNKAMKERRESQEVHVLFYVELWSRKALLVGNFGSEV